MSPPPGGFPMPAFSQKALTKLVEKTVPKERDGVPVKNAIIGTVDQEGVAMVVKMHKDEHWGVEMAVRREWGGNIEAGAQVVFSW